MIRTIMVSWITCVCALCVGAEIRATEPPADEAAPTPTSTTEPAVLIDSELVERLVLDRLTAEAIAFRDSHVLRRDEPDFVRVFEYRLNPETALRMTQATQHADDPVVDAYVRWQLLGFIATDAMFDVSAIGPTLPPYTQNPAADHRLVTAFEKIDRRSVHEPSVQREVFLRWDDVRHSTRLAELENVPTRNLRRAVLDALPVDGPDRIRYMIFELEDMIDAGWDTRSIKTRLGRELRERKLDDSITMEQRWSLVRKIESMEGLDRRMVRQVELDPNADNALDVGFGSAAVRSTDVEKWIAYLLRHDPPE